VPIGKKLPGGGTISTRTEVTNTRTKAVETVKEETKPVYSVTDLITSDAAHANEVEAGHETAMSINYQTVRTVALVRLGCDPGREREAFKAAWEIVEDELADRAEWATGALKMLAQFRAKNER
jgi:hypothetical protein